MAGGTFDSSVGKVRPGTYINFKSAAQASVGTSERGIVLLPLINHSWGPAQQFITLSNMAPNASAALLGYSIYDDIETELPRLVEDALSVDGRILSVYDFEFSFEDDSVSIKFSVDTVFGTTVIEEVI